MNTILLSAPFWGSVVGLVAVAAFNAWLSRINQFFFFSRTVGAEFPATARARTIAKDYLLRVGLGCSAGIIALTCAVAFTRFSTYSCFMLGLVVECFCCSAAFARAHRLTGVAIAEGAAGSAESRGTDDTRSAVVTVPLLDPGSFTPTLMLQLVLAPVCAAVAWVAPMAAMHMGFGAFAAATSANGADFLSGLGLGLIAGSVLLCLQLRYFSRHRSSLARFTARGCVLLAWCGAAAMTICAMSVPLHMVITAEAKRIILFTVLGVAILRMFYGWMRARIFTPPQVERSGDRFWRWGLFYYNPQDPTLFIQHRAGPGYTLNFANFLSWPLALAVVADIAFLVSMHLYR